MRHTTRLILASEILLQTSAIVGHMISFTYVPSPELLGYKYTITSLYPFPQLNYWIYEISRAATDPIQLSVAIRNNIPNQAITLLKWNTPLDPQANVLGIFEVREAESGKLVPSLIVKISRKLPPTQDDLVEIPANGVKETQVTLKPMSLDHGAQYKISAKGRWQAVWAGGVDDVTADQLAEFSCASLGDFESNTVLALFK
ncbi:hypothetical protein PABG_02364 [Paracoccidioides brasiliensis Pb03]|nr:hypothetical protein PABG_02364 [Paracoccidioides brasiliensis Pb03]